MNGSGTEFTDGDSITASGGATGTISSGGVGTAANEFTFTTSGGTEDLYLGTTLSVLGDRTYRFDVSDSSMSGLVFKLSETVNGEWGPDGTAGNTDDGTEYTTGKTTNGTAGSSGAYVQYDLTANTSVYLELSIFMKEQLELLLTQTSEEQTDFSLHQVHILMTLFTFTMFLEHG